MKFYVTAQRNRRNAPTCAVTIDALPEFGAKSHGKSVNLNAAPATDDKMSEFVNENDNRQENDEGRNHIGDGR